MNALLAGLFSVAIYTIANALLGRQLRHRTPIQPGPILALGGVAFSLQLLSLHHLIHTGNGFDLSLFHVLSLVSWLGAGVSILFSLYRPVISLTLIAFPLAVLSQLLSLFVDVPYTPLANLPPGAEAHILLSILAYSLLTAATGLAVLLGWQNGRLKEKRPLLPLRFLPPVQTLEHLLFETIAIGFVLLSLAIASGFIYLDNIFAQHLVHKTILSMAAWLVFAALLAGRYFLGWRGRTAIRWTVSGFVLLVMAFYGSKFVLELVLHQPGAGI